MHDRLRGAVDGSHEVTADSVVAHDPLDLAPCQEQYGISSHHGQHRAEYRPGLCLRGGAPHQPRIGLIPNACPQRDISRSQLAEQIQIRRLAPAEVEEQLDALAGVLLDCVSGGASVSYMAPFSREQARAAFEAVAAEVEQGRRLLLAAFASGDLVGTVQLVLALPPNQPHRGEIAKLLVHRSARGRGVARLLMEGAEAEARAEGKTLLVLDTVTGSTAERLYERLGWNRVGVIPDYALYPDGRPCDTTVFWKSL